MAKMLDEIDTCLLQATQNGFPLVEEPFREIALKTNIDEDEVIARLRKLKQLKIIRRIGASINNRKIGILANAMVCWKVPEKRLDDVGGIFSSKDHVTHCYVRKTIPGRWTHNVFTVLHGFNEGIVEELVKEMSESTGIEDYMILFSSREFKKTSNGRIDRNAIKLNGDKVN